MRFKILPLVLLLGLCFASCSKKEGATSLVIREDTNISSSELKLTAGMKVILSGKLSFPNEDLHIEGTPQSPVVFLLTGKSACLNISSQTASISNCVFITESNFYSSSPILTFTGKNLTMQNVEFSGFTRKSGIIQIGCPGSQSKADLESLSITSCEADTLINCWNATDVVLSNLMLGDNKCFRDDSCAVSLGNGQNMMKLCSSTISVSSGRVRIDVEELRDSTFSGRFYVFANKVSNCTFINSEFSLSTRSSDTLEDAAVQDCTFFFNHERMVVDSDLPERLFSKLFQRNEFFFDLGFCIEEINAAREKAGKPLFDEDTGLPGSYDHWVTFEYNEIERVLAAMAKTNRVYVKMSIEDYNKHFKRYLDAPLLESKLHPGWMRMHKEE